MKRKLALPFAVLSMVLCVGLSACGGPKEDPSNSGSQNPSSSTSAVQQKISIKAAENKTKLILGEKVQLTAQVGSDALAGVTWKSDKPEIATVSDAGLVESKAVGKATITASKEGYKDATIQITVDLQTIKVTATKPEVVRGQEITLTSDVAGVTWESANQAIATVDQSGKVKGVAVGEVVISAKKQGYNDGKLSIKVVRPEPTAILHMEDADHFAADGEWLSSGRGGGDTPVYTPNGGTPSDGTCIAYFGEGDKETLTFTASAAVKAELVITMLNRSAYDDLGKCFTAKVNETEVKFDGVAYAGSTDYPIIGITLGEHTLKNGKNVVEFNFLGASPYLDDLQIYAESAATFTVVPAPEKQAVTVKNASIEIAEGATAQIESDLTELSYKSANDAIASVSETGLVTANAVGETEITVSKSGYKNAKVAVKVTEKAGVFKVEAETGTFAEDNPVTFREVSSGETLTDSFPEGAKLTLKFEGVKAGKYTLAFNARGNSSSTPIILKDAVSMKFNNADVTIGEDVQVLTRTVKNYVIGEVTAINGDNILEITALSATRPNFDFFRLIPVAA